MGNISNSNRNLPRDPYQGADGALFGFGALAGLGIAATSLGYVFGGSALAGAWILLALVAFIFFLVLLVRSESRPVASIVLLGLGAVWSACFGFIVFDNHWLAFTPATWVLDGLFVAALVSGAWDTLKTWARILSALTAAALVTATMVLPRPPGGDGPMDTAEKWKIDVDVADAADNTPLAGARVLCATVMQWESALKLEDTAARTTGPDGRIDTWEFEEDPRLKIVICNAWKHADDGNAGYPPETQIVAAPAGGGSYTLQFALRENPHPDTSFLALDLSGAFSEKNWFTLVFELWEGEPQGYVGSTDGPQPLVRKTYAQLEGGFTLSSMQAANGLTLRYHYEGPARGEGLAPPYSEVQLVPVDPIPAGARHRIALTIPTNQGHD